MGDRLFYMVYTNPLEGHEEAYDEWYEKFHIPEILSVPGMISAQRTELKVTETGRAGGFSPETHRYCVVYEMDGDPDEVMAAIREKSMTGEFHPPVDVDQATVQMSWWTQVGDKQFAPER
jgi:hypothetical protein